MNLSIDAAQKEALAANLNDLEKENDDNFNQSEEYLWLNDFMESPIFKGIQGQLNKFMQSEYFSPIEISEKDIEVLARTQKEIIRLMQDPEKLEKVLGDTLPGINQSLLLPQDQEDSED